MSSTSLFQEVKNSGGGGYKGGVKHSAGTWWCGEMECGGLEPGKPHPWAGDRLEGGKEGALGRGYLYIMLREGRDSSKKT